MSNQELEILCQGCEKTFKTFLEKMAEHNGTLTCPNCGKTHLYETEETAKHKPVRPSGN